MSKKIVCIIEKCMGCHTCELACAIAHSGGKELWEIVAAGENPGYRIHVEHHGPHCIPLSCQHCEEAACVLACPTGAVHRYAPGKPVLVEEPKCIGCSMCVQACPFGVMAMRPTGKVAFKCDLCIERLAKGLAPACVSSCPTRALSVEDEPVSNKQKRQAAVERILEAQAAGAAESRPRAGP